MARATNAEPTYAGLLGLDRLPAVVKLLNAAVTVSVSSVIAWSAWETPIYRETYYQWQFYNWPLVFLLAWPLCAVMIWLRLTGLRWRWAIAAAALTLVGYFVMLRLQSYLYHSIGS